MATCKICGRGCSHQQVVDERATLSTVLSGVEGWILENGRALKDVPNLEELLAWIRRGNGGGNE